MAVPLLSIASFLLASGCVSEDCNSMGCSTHVDIQLSSPLTESGSYEIQAIGGTETFTCTVSVPSVGGDSCDAGLSVRREEITSSDGDSVSGRAGDSIVGFQLQGDFDNLDISISKDGGAPTESDIEPQYEGVEVNGEGCGECMIAEHEI